MPKLIKQLCSLMLIAWTFSTLTACAAPRVWMAQKGQVQDWETKQPIEGAIVVALWQGDIPIPPAEFMMTCYHVESTATDDGGYFKIPMYTEGPGLVVDRYVDIIAYKAGYKTSTYERENYPGKHIRHDRERNIHFLEKDDRSTRERLEYLLNISGNCFSEEYKQLTLYIKAIYDEATSIAVTKENKKKAEFILYDLEKLELGYEEAQKRYLARP